MAVHRMDELGLSISLTILALILALIAVFAGWWVWQKRKIDLTKSWPEAEATIESGAFEFVTGSEYAEVRLPVLAFSYRVDGAYHSGRFALRPYLSDLDESLPTRLIGRRLPVRYNPQSADVWFIPEEFIEGCKVEQKLGPHVVDYSPRN
jgi:hypothetical protein